MSDGYALTEDDLLLEPEYARYRQIYDILSLKLKHLEAIRTTTGHGTLQDAINDVHNLEEQTVKIFGELLAKKKRLQKTGKMHPYVITNNPTIQ